MLLPPCYPRTQRKYSVAKIETSDTYEKGLPKAGGLSDLRMGTMDKHGVLCTTDGADMKDCPGYFGHIELAKPMYHCGFIKTVVRVLRCVSYATSRLLLDKVGLTWKLHCMMPHAVRMRQRAECVGVCMCAVCRKAHATHLHCMRAQPWGRGWAEAWVDAGCTGCVCAVCFVCMCGWMEGGCVAALEAGWRQSHGMCSCCRFGAVQPAYPHLHPACLQGSVHACNASMGVVGRAVGAVLAAPGALEPQSRNSQQAAIRRSSGSRRRRRDSSIQYTAVAVAALSLWQQQASCRAAAAGATTLSTPPRAAVAAV